MYNSQEHSPYLSYIVETFYVPLKSARQMYRACQVCLVNRVEASQHQQQS